MRFECEGKIRLGPLPWETSERLAQFSGNWLLFEPAGNAVVVRQSQPAGCPALTGVACEMISLIYSIPAELRNAMPGGTIYVRDSLGDLLRVVVEHGEIRVQWPQKEYAQPVYVPPDTVLNEVASKSARIRGWARFAGSCGRAGELRKFVEQFDGLYPEGELPSECEQNLVYVRFKEVNIGPKELIAKLRELAESEESLQAELEVTPIEAGRNDAGFRIHIRDGQISAMRPSLWKQA